MSEPSTSPKDSGAEETHKDEESSEAKEAKEVQTLYPAVGPSTSASEILRPLSQVTSQRSFPLPNSGYLASLVGKQSKQDTGSAHVSDMHEQPLQSDSSSSATTEQFDSESIQKFTTAVWQSMPEQNMPASVASSSEPLDHVVSSGQVSPSPYASIFPEGTDSSPLFLVRCADYENTSGDESVRKYSESLQLFRNNEEDSGKIWKRRVIEYR